MESVKRLVDRVLEFITIILLLVMVGVTTWQVISRYVLTAPSTMTDEFVKFTLMLYGCFKAVSITIDQISPSLQISMGLVYLSLPVAGILMIFYSLINILELVKEKKAGLEA